MKLSKFISFLFHPILMPTYTLLLFFQFFPIVAQYMSDEKKTIIVRLTIIFTLLFPLISVYILKKLKIVSSIYMENKEERRWPLLITIGCYYLLFKLFEGFYIYSDVGKLLLGAMLILIFSAIISNFWKISLHMLGIGGVFGAFLALQYLFGGDISLIIFLILCAGFVGYARINEGAHNLKQVYMGFLLGVMIEFLIFVF